VGRRDRVRGHPRDHVGRRRRRGRSPALMVFAP
jgi:hypothetical protein